MDSQPPTEQKPETQESLHTIKTLLEWKAPGRPYAKRSKQYYLTGLLILVPIQIILFLFAQYMLMLVVMSLAFLAYALASVPPHDFYYRVSTEGVMVEDHFFIWRELYDFYFRMREGTDVLYIRTHALIPGALIISLGNLDKEKVKTTLLPYLPYREYVKPTFMEKAGDWLVKTFPLEKPKAA